jgi:hypothetical protein
MVVALVCVTIILGIAWIQSQAAVEVVRIQAEAIRQGRVEDAYSLFSSEYRAGISLGTFRRWLNRQTHLATHHGIRIWGRSVWRGVAVLWGSFQDDQGRSYPIRYQLVREDGSWRVDNLRVQDMVPDSLSDAERFNYI